jgi:NitT/TauT family transport system substrate-binding protein
MIRTVRWLVAGAVAALGIGAAQAQDKVVMTIPTVQSAFAYAYIAQEKGYFKEEGLEVEIVVGTGGMATPALISGSVQYSSSTASAMSAILKGAALKIVLVGQSQPIQEIWSFDPKVRTFEDLKGKMLATTVRGGSDELLVRMLLKQRGLPLDFVGFTPLGRGPTRIAAILAGNQPYTLLARTDLGELEKAGMLAKGRRVLKFSDHVELQTGGLASSAAELGENRDRAKRMLRALWKGTIYLQKNPAGTMEIVRRKLPNLTPQAIDFDYRGAIEDLDTDGVISREGQMRELAERAELLKVPADKVPAPEKVYDFSLIEAVKKELAASGWSPGR